MRLNRWMAGLTLGVLAATLTFDAEAQRRLGGARNIGKQSPQVQRQAAPPAQQSPQAAPAQPGAQQAVPAKAGAGAAGAAARPASPWRGALMGVAAGLGIAALASYLGFGETLSMILTVMLIGLVVMLVVGFLLRRFRGPQPAYAPAARRAEPGPGTYSNVGYETAPAPMQRTVIDATGGARPGSAMDQFSRGAPASLAPWDVPAGFDSEAFLARAKENFVRLQRAWDRGDLEEMSDFTTNDLFVTLTHDLRARGGRTTTEVEKLDASLLGIESGPVEHVASVKFEGTLRVDGEVEQVSEVWNLSKPVRGGSGWVLAGIQQLA